MIHSDGHSALVYVTSYDQSKSCDSTMIMSGPLSSSTSSVSFWSDASSQSSDDSSVTSDFSTLPSTPSPCPATSLKSIHQEIRPTHAHGPSNLVPNFGFSPKECQRSKRRSLAKEVRNVLPAKLGYHGHKKVNFVDSLVDSSAQIVEAIWSSSLAPYRIGVETKEVLPLRTFIQETLRRSRTSYSTLQVTLYYLILIKPHVLRQQQQQQRSMVSLEKSHHRWALLCGRRMFLTALILASKYLQDRNYSARAWSKISGLNILEINQNEIMFLSALNWQLHVTEAIFLRWTEIVLKYTTISSPSDGATALFCSETSANWKAIVLGLNARLDNITDVISRSKNLIVNSPRDISHMHVVMDITSAGHDQKKTPTITSLLPPNYLEPSPSTYPPRRRVPALGLLPTPRLTPQIGVFNTPAINIASNVHFMAGKTSTETESGLNFPTANLKGMNPNFKHTSASSDSCHYPSIQSPSFLTPSPDSITSDVLSQTLHSSSIGPISVQAADFKKSNTIHNNEMRLSPIELGIQKHGEYDYYSLNGLYIKNKFQKSTGLFKQSSKEEDIYKKLCSNNDGEVANTLQNVHYHSGLDIPYLWVDQSCKISPDLGIHRRRNTCAPFGGAYQRPSVKRRGVEIDPSPSARGIDCIGNVSLGGKSNDNDNLSSIRSKNMISSSSSSSRGRSSINRDPIGINIWASNNAPPRKRTCYNLEACRELSYSNLHPNLYDGLSIFPGWSGI